MRLKKVIKNIVIEDCDGVIWNRLWERYSEGTLDEDQMILCDYYSGINGEGHHCFFDNNGSHLSDIMISLKRQLPDGFYGIIYRAYAAYQKDLFVTRRCTKADEYYYINEQVIVNILLQYARAYTE